LFPPHIGKVKRFLSQLLSVHGVFYGRKRMIDLRSSCRGIHISSHYLEKCSTSRMGTVIKLFDLIIRDLNVTIDQSMKVLSLLDYIQKWILEL
jgi:hypothetical protein